MTNTVFFSWQSDRSTREGRNFIEKALQSAVAKLSADLTIEEAMRDGLAVDKDTMGVPGSPPIFDTILSKISRCAAFVADLTFCGNRCGGDLTPNPNVLIEYGWALGTLGHKQMIGIMNVAHGDPNKHQLPFNLRVFRFPITYNLPDNASDDTRKEERQKLTSAFETAIKDILGSDEFKAKLPKQPERAQFPRKIPLDGRARFRQPQTPLGFAKDTMGLMIGSPNAIPINLAAGLAMWLRVMPSHDPGRRWLASNLRREAFPLTVAPLLRLTGSVGFLQGEDGCGYYPIWRDDNIALSIAYVFETSEIWIIDTSLGNAPEYLEFREGKFIDTLKICESLLDHLDQKKPYSWVAGVEGMKGRKVLIPQGRMPIGVCLTNCVEVEGVYNEGDKADELLVPFFEKFFDQCGVTRPVTAQPTAGVAVK